MTTYQKNKPKSIQKMFGSIAKQYDRTNAILSFNLHRYWNAQLVKDLPKGGAYLDLCCGTGEIAATYLKYQGVPEKLYLLDFCQEMLECAKTKISQDAEYIQADAQEIPLPDASVDFVTVAYGIRNVQDPKKCVKDVLRVLRPGGTFSILELTKPKNPVVNFGHQCYLRTFLPVIGKLVAANQQAYEYLCSSIQAFTPPEELEKTMQEVGFSKTRVRPLTFGTATLITGVK